MKSTISVFLLLLSLNVLSADKLVKVKMETSKGDIILELNETKAPITVKNFLAYVDKGFYKGTIFHRVINGFMIQGGGFDKKMNKKSTMDPIKLESNNGLRNDEGTIAMARTNVPNSATSQFFINVKNNDSLNYSPGNDGYAVFGNVIKGMPVVNKIKKTTTTMKGFHRDVPVEEIVIKNVTRIK